MPSSAVPVIVHSHLRWDFVWQRPQQILSRLAEHHPILFIEEPQRAAQPAIAITEPHPNLFRLVPSLPQDDVDAQCEALLPHVYRALNEPPLAGRFHSPLQWFYSPMSAPTLLGEFGAAGVVYDCMDELSSFRFAPPDIGAREQFLLANADVVFTGGYQLYLAKSRQNPNTHFFGCGVDVEHFGKARLAGTPLPPEIARLPKPVLGYFGVIDERIDYALLAGLAAAYPEASVAMVGPFAKVDPEALPRAPNLHWLGPRAYAELPAVVKAFDVCLMPFALNEATRFINPTKTLEYMAAGKPVVSTAVPDVVHHFTPIVEVADTAQAFARAVWRAYEAPSGERIDAGIERANGATWDATVKAMRALMLEVTAPATLAAAAA